MDGALTLAGIGNLGAQRARQISKRTDKLQHNSSIANAIAKTIPNILAIAFASGAAHILNGLTKKIVDATVWFSGADAILARSHSQGSSVDPTGELDAELVRLESHLVSLRKTLSEMPDISGMPKTARDKITRSRDDLSKATDSLGEVVSALRKLVREGDAHLIEKAELAQLDSQFDAFICSINSPSSDQPDPEVLRLARAALGSQPHFD
jgi:hypothetical protein